MEAVQEFVDELRGAWRIQQRWDGMRQRIADQHVLLSQWAKEPLENGTLLLGVANIFQQDGEDLHCIIVPAMLLHVQEREIDTAALPAQMTFANQTLRLLSRIRADSAGPLIRTDVLMQIHHCFKDLASIAHKAVAIHCATGEPMRCIRPLLNIVQFLAHRQHHPSTLTPFHALFLQCCLATSSYTVAAQMLSVTEILEVSPRVPVSSYDLLSYFYFAGMCCLAVKDYEAALDAFVTCITTSADAISVVVAQAITKARLVSLIHLQAPLHLPKYTSSVVQRLSKQPNVAYDKIEALFLRRDARGLEDCLAEHADTLRADQTQSLARICLEACTAHDIRQLTNTYLTLSLEDIRQQVGAAGGRSTEEQVLSLIGAGSIHARIDQKKGVVAFLDAPEGEGDGGSGSSVNGDLERFVAATMHSAQTMRELKRGVLASKEYVTKSSGMRGGSGGVSAAAVWEADEIV